MDIIAWGARVSTAFIDRVRWIVEDLDIGDSTADGINKLMACIAWESGRTFSASVVNKAGSGATGLIQFMPTTARGLGTTTVRLAQMTAEDQLNYVWKYFAPYKGKLRTLADVYMAILWPAAVGKPDTATLWDKDERPTTYRQNSGLDVNTDGTITKAEASAKVMALLIEGMKPGNALRIDAPADTPRVVDVVEDRLKEAAEVYRDMTPVLANIGIALPEEVQEPITKLDTVKKAISGTTGNFTGIALILGSLLLNPDFARNLGAFTLALSRGESVWGAAAAVVGAGLIAYKSTKTRTDPG